MGAWTKCLGSPGLCRPPSQQREGQHHASPQLPLVSADSAAILRLPKPCWLRANTVSSRLEAKGVRRASRRAHSAARTDTASRGGAGSRVSSGQAGQWVASLML